MLSYRSLSFSALSRSPGDDCCHLVPLAPRFDHAKKKNGSRSEKYALKVMTCGFSTASGLANSVNKAFNTWPIIEILYCWKISGVW